ncbi:MAG: hypothetical protein IKV80_01090 [Bacteroidales bacterium]|nr:hypothetical protein [Bacteroidales bacterium]
MNQKQKNIIERKTKDFCEEVQHIKLTEENKRIYNAFVYKRAKPYKFEIIDKYSNTIRFVLCTNKLDDGVLHILLKHYQGKVGSVSAFEILNFCEVIRNGEISVNENTMVYTLKQNGQTFKLIVALKKSQTGTNILKSFYSDRK